MASVAAAKELRRSCARTLPKQVLIGHGLQIEGRQPISPKIIGTTQTVAVKRQFNGQPTRSSLHCTRLPNHDISFHGRLVQRTSTLSNLSRIRMGTMALTMLIGAKPQTALRGSAHFLSRGSTLKRGKPCGQRRTRAAHGQERLKDVANSGHYSGTLHDTGSRRDSGIVSRDSYTSWRVGIVVERPPQPTKRKPHSLFDGKCQRSSSSVG